jgi:methionyl-tRNA synthetase
MSLPFMSSPKSFYITTAIDYVNAAPHLGHAYEKIATDVMARFHRLLGDQVFFLTGSDEHGTKIEKTAAKRGLTPKQHTDETVEDFKAAWAYLNLSYDRFIRTTDAEHYAVVGQLWRKLAAKGDIYKKRYQGLYCAGCEKFVNERDLDEAGHCPHHQVAPEVVEEENYFFRLSRYKDALRALIQGESFTPPEGKESVCIQNFVKPDFRAAETLSMIDELEDISVSRNRSAVSWGIPVPDDDEQVIYVWIDALSNYITGVGYLQETPEQKSLFKQFWPANIHMVGKDILRFHAIYWPAMLMAAEVTLPQQVFAHGFININDAKISKSVGNVVSPFTLRDRFDLPNPDPIRYYLMTVAAMGQDGSFTEEDFKLRVNADLANNLGNLLNRTLAMVGKYFEGVVPSTSKALPADRKRFDEISAAYASFDYIKAASLSLEFVDAANRAINNQEPWTLFKEGKLDELATLMATVLETLRQVALLLSPITPTMSENMWSQLGFESTLLDANQRPNVLWSALWESPLPVGQKLNPQGPVLPRLDSELAGADKSKKTAGAPTKP